MPTVIVLAMHGAPPDDYPRAKLKEYFQTHTQIEAMEHSRPSNGQNGKGRELRQRFESLDAKMRAWPRSEKNDPFYAGSMTLARELERKVGLPVLVGFNEFCAPSLEDAFEEAHTSGADRVVVITPMMTSGGSHAEVDIPMKIGKAEDLYTDMDFFYAWPFELKGVASFLAKQAGQYLPFHEEPEQIWR